MVTETARLLDALGALGIKVALSPDGHLRTSPSGAVPVELRAAIREHKAELIHLLSIQSGPPAADICCPSCRRIDYLPLKDGWRRCWACGNRWGPGESVDPGDPPDLGNVAPRPEFGATVSSASMIAENACPQCGSRRATVGEVGPAGATLRCVSCGWQYLTARPTQPTWAVKKAAGESNVGRP